MEIFVDSAEVDKIRQLHEMGLVDGVTTNPTLIKQAGKDHKKTIQEISSFMKGPLSVETLSEDAEGMIKEAEEYITWGKNIVVKVIMTPEGMKAVRALSKKKIKTNVTLVFSPLQACRTALQQMCILIVEPHKNPPFSKSPILEILSHHTNFCGN